MTVIVALPAATPVTKPLLLTVAIEVLLLLQVTDLLVASDGATVAVSWVVIPMPTYPEVLSSVTPVTAAVTVTEQVAVLLPSTVVTVMVALPPPTAVTRPLLLTVATDVLLLDQVTLLLLALPGDTVAVSCSVFPFAMVVEDLFRLTPVTETVTDTVQVAVNPPSAVVTVMVALPAPTAVTRPLLLTVATAVLLLLHVTDLLVASEGATVAVSCSVLPLVRDVEDLLSETAVTGCVTVTLQVAVKAPLSVVAVMVAEPALTAVILPVLSTVATAVLSLDHVTDGLVALSGVMDAES